ncbi:MAG: DUF3793 family protein [Muricomes sp.]
MIEEYLIRHCSPTLAGLKSGSLFAYAFQNEEEFYNEIGRIERLLLSKGLCMMIAKRQNQRALIYVYREARLNEDLNKSGVRWFLSAYGYDAQDTELLLERLCERIRESEEFPHEIGIFLGYPLGDVIGFIQNQGKRCKCVGCWKVYCDEADAQRTFNKFRKCRDVYGRLWENGKSLTQLIVAA